MQLLNDIFIIKGMQVNDDRAQATGTLNPEHPVFAAHFPGRPVLPGVCQVRLATELLRVMEGRHLRLTSAKNIKYTGLITPQVSPLDVFFSNIVRTDNGIDCRVVFKSDSEVFSKMSLSYSL